MKVYVINLERRTDRRDRVRKHLVAIGLRPVFIDAIDGKALSMDPPGALVNPAIHGCFMSHVKVFKTLLCQPQEDFALILEDDVVLDSSVNWPHFLNHLEIAMTTASLDFLQLGFITSLYRSGIRNRLNRLHGRVSGSSSLTGPEFKIDYQPGIARAGAHCYVISRKFAEATHHLNQPVWLPTDGFFERLASSSLETNHVHMGCSTRSLAEQESRRRQGLSIDSDIEFS